MDVTVYTINGTSIGGDTYKDAKLSVCKGYTIKGEGSVNCRSATMDVSIYIA